MVSKADELIGDLSTDDKKPDDKAKAKKDPADNKDVDEAAKLTAAKDAAAPGAKSEALKGLDTPTDDLSVADAKKDLAEAVDEKKEAEQAANEAKAMEVSAKADDDAKVQAEAKRAPQDIIDAAEKVAEAKKDEEGGPVARRGAPRVAEGKTLEPGEGQQPDPFMGVSRQTRQEMEHGRSIVKGRG